MSVSVLSLNLFLRPPFVKTNTSDHKDGRTAYFINHILGRHDVYCLQEVFGALSTRKSRIIKAAMAKGYVHVAESPSPNFFSSYLIDGGLLVLSKLPILEHHFQTYSVREQPDSLAQKGLLYCKLLAHGSFIHLITTHAQSSYINCSVQSFWAHRLARRQQMREIRQFLDKSGLAHEFCLIVGDLNVDARERLRPAPKGIELDDDYAEMVAILKGSHDILDVLKLKYGESPATFARVTSTGEAEERVLTAIEDYGLQNCLDYALILNLSASRFQVDLEETYVDPMLVTGHIFTQLSDHCALQICFRNA